MYALSTVSKQFLVIFKELFASKIIPLVAYKILVLCMIMQKTEIGFMKILSMNDLKMEKMYAITYLNNIYNFKINVIQKIYHEVIQLKKF